VVSCSLLTVHTTPAIALQLMRGSYNGQQRPLTSKKDTKFHSVCFRILVSGNSYNLVRKTKFRPKVLLEFLQDAQEGCRVEKVKLMILSLQLLGNWATAHPRNILKWIDESCSLPKWFRSCPSEMTKTPLCMLTHASVNGN